LYEKQQVLHRCSTTFALRLSSQKQRQACWISGTPAVLHVSMERGEKASEEELPPAPKEGSYRILKTSFFS